MSTAARGPATADWCRDELILALGVYLRLDGAVPGPWRPEITELNGLLRGAHFHAVAAKQANFRSPASVVMKLMNFRSIDPNYGGKGLSAGGRLDRAVWQEVASDRPRLVATTAATRHFLYGREYYRATEPIDGWLVEAEKGRSSRLCISRANGMPVSFGPKSSKFWNQPAG